MRLDIYLVKGGTSVVALSKLYDIDTDQYVNDASVTAEIRDRTTDTPIVGLDNLVFSRAASDEAGRYTAFAPHTVTAALTVGQAVKGIATAVMADGSRMIFTGLGRVYEAAPPPPIRR